MIHSELKIVIHNYILWKFFLVNKFTCSCCSSSHIGEASRHFKTSIEEHIKKGNKSHIFKHLHSTTTCFDSCDSLSINIFDKANSKFDLKIKEALHINWIKLNLNTQQKVFSFHTSTIACVILFFLPVFTLFFVFLFHLWLSLMLPCYFISIQHTLHHPSSFHLLFSLYLTLIVSMFYCLNYTSLLLYLIITQLVNMFYTNYVINICPRQLLWFT